MKKFFYLAFAALAIMACGDGNDPNALEINPVSDNGMLPGKFTVDDKGTQVQFAQGNLQYQASTDTWRFAYNQWEYTAKGWLGYFMWGTGDKTNKTYQEVYSSSFTDWGINPISNGGNESNRWRTLKKDEWQYILVGRNKAAELIGLGRVAGQNGAILLPDNWVMPAEVPAFAPGITKGMEADIYGYEEHSDYGAYTEEVDHYKDNIYTADQWRVMEASGAVFLPAVGYLEHGKIKHNSETCFYWAQEDYQSYGCGLNIEWNQIIVSSYGHKVIGHCVRLVR